MSKLSPAEIIEAVRQIYTLLRMLDGQQSLAGIILTDESYDTVKQRFGDAKIPFRSAELELDPTMEHSFVVGNLLILRGTRLR